jgi:hypothetical protein
MLTIESVIITWLSVQWFARNSHNFLLILQLWGGVDKIAVDGRTAGHGMKDRGAGLCGHVEPYDPLVFALHAMMSLLVCLALELVACLLHRCPALDIACTTSRSITTLHVSDNDTAIRYCFYHYFTRIYLYNQ